MLICDTHADTLFAMQDPKRNPNLPFDITKERLLCTDDIRVQALALFVGPSGMRGEDAQIIARELNAFETLKAQGFVQITELSQARAGVANAMLTIEGGEAFLQDENTVSHFARLGVRAAALVWNHENLLAYPATGKENKGLKAFGHRVVARMRENRMAVDISHLNARGTAEVMDADIPPMASHSCARALCNQPRNLTDAQLRALFAIGGYVGVNFYARFLDHSGQADLNRVIDHMVHMCALGGEKCVGLGSDFDGIDEYPEGLRRADDVPKLLEGLRARGFDEPLVRGIAGENFAAYMKKL
ncbi:MAG: membrane dipeptidase [Clostridia bacterium]